MQTIFFKPPPTEKLIFPLGIVGESNYQNNIKEVILFEHMVEKEDLQYSDNTLIASLILDDANEFDPGNAVRIEIENKIVGYLSKEDAKAYRKELNHLELKDIIGTCQASVNMTRENTRQKMNFGVWLAIEPGRRHLEIGEPPAKKKGCLPVAILATLILLIAKS